MKLYFQSLPVLAGIVLSMSLFTSCTKEGVQNTTVFNIAQTANNSHLVNTDEVSLTQEGVYQKLVLRPNAKTGQDVYVDRQGTTGGSNLNYVP